MGGYQIYGRFNVFRCRAGIGDELQCGFDPKDRQLIAMLIGADMFTNVRLVGVGI